MNLKSQIELLAGLENVEMEGNPIRPPKGPGKYLQKSGALWCVRSGNSQDKNFGCFGSKQQAEDVMNGKSFTGLEAGMDILDLYGYGTSEGAQKAWDTRGRGRKPKSKTREKFRVPVSKEPMKNVTQIKEQYKDVGASLGKLKKVIEVAHVDLEHTERVRSTAGKIAHLVKSIGEWHHGIQQFGELLKRIGEAMGWVVGVAEMAQHSTAIHNAMMWAYHALHPVIQTIASSGALHFEGEEIDAGNLSQYGQTGWQYGKREMARSTGYIPSKSLAGFPSMDKSGGRGIGKVTMPPGMRAPTHLRPPQPKMSVPLHVKYPTAKIAHVGNPPSVPRVRDTSVPKPMIPKISTPHTGLSRKNMLGYSDWGEPMVGGMAHAHIEPTTWFHPPSLTQREDNEKTRIPSDGPREDNDRFLDVTKRNSKDTKEFRMKLLRRKTPGGDPPMVPVHTTLLAPATAAYLPSGLFASRSRQRRRVGGGMYTSFDRKGCI